MSVRFEIFEGPDSGQVFEYPGNTSFVVGRNVKERSGLRVPTDPYMSRNHFLVVVGVGECTIRDCGSSNGTFVNEQRIREIEVGDGDSIRAGRTRLTVRMEPLDSEESLEPSEDAVAERFELGERLGGAGAARVFRARDRESGLDVALKFLRIDLTGSVEVLPMFRRELEAATTLRHDHIVPVLATGVRADEAWIALAWIDGPTLEERVERGPLFTEEQAIDLGRHVLDGVVHAHDLGFVHRDIKPENILLQRQDYGYRPMLTDFGLAKRQGHADSTLTSTGTIRGTPRYMPPEQLLDSRSAGPAADQFSVAATLYYALTGAWHYDQGDESIWEVLLRGGAVPLRQRRRRMGEGIERVLAKALEGAPDARYPTARAFRSALLKLRSEDGAATRPE